MTERLVQMLLTPPVGRCSREEMMACERAQEAQVVDQYPVVGEEGQEDRHRRQGAAAVAPEEPGPQRDQEHLDGDEEQGGIRDSDENIRKA